MPARIRTPSTGLAAALAVLAALPATAQVVDRVSVPNDPLVLGRHGNGDSFAGGRRVVSADGRWLVFASNADNLADGGSGGGYRIYLRDRQLGTLERLTPPSTAIETEATISADGQVIAFVSSDTALLPGDDNGYRDVFVYDLASRTFERVSNRTDGAPGDQQSESPTLSGDGDRVAFQSRADDLPDAIPGHTQSYVFQRSTGELRALGLTPAGAPANDSTSAPWLSLDGHRACFESRASDLVPGDSNGKDDVFLADLDDGSVRLISHDAAGNAGDGYSYDCMMADATGEIAFVSSSGNLVAGDGNGHDDAFVADPASGTIDRVSVTDNGDEVDGWAYEVWLSPNGRQVVWETDAEGLPGAPASHDDLYLRDRDAGRTWRVSQPLDPTQPSDSGSTAGGVLDDGRVWYFSKAGNFVAGDGNNRYDVFLWQAGSVTLESQAATALPAGAGGDTPSVSADGSRVVFVSSAPALLQPLGADRAQVFLYRRASRTLELVSRAVDGGPADGACVDARISADGDHVTFASTASNLVADGGNGQQQVFLRDLDAAQTTRLSSAEDGSAGNATSFAPSIAADGDSVAFATYANNLVTGNSGGGWVWRRSSGLERFDVAADGTPLNAMTQHPELSGDGLHVGFDSRVANIVPGVGNGNWQIYLKNLVDGSLTLLSATADGQPSSGPVYRLSLSHDGAVAAFISVSSNLPDGNGEPALFAAADGTVQRLTPPYYNDRVSTEDHTSVSADGRFVAFASSVIYTDGDDNGRRDVFVYDRRKSRTARASIDAHRHELAADSGTAMLAADGNWLTFVTDPGTAIDVPDRIATGASEVLLGNNPLGDRLFEDGFGD